MDEKEKVINSLVKEYTEYLYKFSLEELSLITNWNVFTLREAKRIAEKEKPIRGFGF